MQIYGGKLFVLCHYADKSRDHKHFDGGGMFLICHMTSPELMFKRLCEFMGGSSSL